VNIFYLRLESRIIIYKNDFLKKLSEKIEDEGIQRTKGSVTRKGYDTEGYGYQWCVNRFNEVLGGDWTFGWSIIRDIEGKFKNGRPFFDITVKVWIKILDCDERHCVGGHISGNYVDALKGAITNGFKKTAAFWGVGHHAYTGCIDEDNKPIPVEDSAKIINEVFPQDQKPKDFDSLQPIEKFNQIMGIIPDGVREYIENKDNKEKYNFFVEHNWSVPAMDAFCMMKQNDEEIPF
jgi:hypothetical protein